MEIECVFFGPLKETVCGPNITCCLGDDATMADLIESLVASYEGLGETLLTDAGELQESLVITVNKRNLHQLDGLSTPLEDGQTVRFTPAIQGG